MNTKTYFILLLSFKFLIITSQSHKTKQIDDLITEANKIGIFNGNVIVSQKGNIIYQNALGFSDYKKSKKLTELFSMPVGSISKEFNSVGILYLKEKGKLKLEDKVSDYINYLPDWANKIQIKDLIEYTSGLPQMSKNSDSEYISELKKIQKLEFSPGSGYIYSNANIFLQQEIIRNISLMSYSDFLKKNLFFKLKIKGGEIPKNAVLSQNMAGSFDNDFKETTFIHGGGEMYFTIGDIYRWEKALHSGKIISDLSLFYLGKSFDKNTESSLGNVQYNNYKILEHSHQGSGNNYESFVYYNSENDTIIILMTNNQNFKVSEIADCIQNILNSKSFSIPKKSIYLDIRGKLLYNFSEGMAYYKEIKSSKKEIYDFSNEGLDLINSAKYLMRRNKFEDAIKILDLSTNVDLTDKSRISNALFLIGECYFKINDLEMSKSFYKQAFVLDSNNRQAENVLKVMMKN